MFCSALAGFAGTGQARPRPGIKVRRVLGGGIVTSKNAVHPLCPSVHPYYA
jgi:hypothetical protein